MFNTYKESPEEEGALAGFVCISWCLKEKSFFLFFRVSFMRKINELNMSLAKIPKSTTFSKQILIGGKGKKWGKNGEGKKEKKKVVIKKLKTPIHLKQQRDTKKLKVPLKRENYSYKKKLGFKEAMVVFPKISFNRHPTSKKE